MNELTPRTILITGAARGIGAACARRFAGRGDNVVLVGLEPEALHAVRAECGERALAIEADIRDAEAMARAVASAGERFGGLDVVIANAGIGALGPLATTDPAAFRATVDVDIVGTFTTIQAVVPALQRRRGYLLVISSAAVGAHTPAFGGYSAAKAAVEMLAGTARIELAVQGVAVGTAYFSFIDTEFVREAQESSTFRALRASIPWPLNRIAPVKTAVDAIERGVDKRLSAVYAPGYTRVVLALRGLIWPVDDKRAARAAPRVLAAYAREAAATDQRTASAPSRPTRMLTESRPDGE